MTAEGRSHTANKERVGIPEVLARIRYEKLTVPVPVKLWPSLANYVKQQGGSAFIRTLILKSLNEPDDSPGYCDPGAGQS